MRKGSTSPRSDPIAAAPLPPSLRRARLLLIIILLLRPLPRADALGRAVQPTLPGGQRRMLAAPTPRRRRAFLVLRPSTRRRRRALSDLLRPDARAHPPACMRPRIPRAMPATLGLSGRARLRADLPGVSAGVRRRRSGGGVEAAAAYPGRRPKAPHPPSAAHGAVTSVITTTTIVSPN